MNAGRKAHVQFLAHDRPGDAQDSEAEDPDHVIRVQLSDSKRSVSELHDEFIDHDGRNERGQVRNELAYVNWVAAILIHLLL